MGGGRRVKVASVGEVEAGQGRVVEADGKTLALFNVDRVFYALDNACAHRGGPLGEGDPDGTTVTRPWHAWRWGGGSGATANNAALLEWCYPVAGPNGASVVAIARQPHCSPPRRLP